MIDSGTRIRGIDVAKGLGILFVVFGHLGGPGGAAPGWLEYAKGLIYQFHVPLFFLLSGMFFRESEGWGAFLKKKFKRLYLPFVVSNIIFLAMDELLRIGSGVHPVAMDEIKHSAKIVLMLATSPMGGATWFLRSLLLCGIVYKLLWKLTGGRKALLWVICALVSVLGMHAPADFSISATMTAMLFYCSGHIVSRSAKDFFALPAWAHALISVTAVSLLVVSSPSGHVDFAMAVFEHEVLALPMAFVGILAVASLSSLIGKWRLAAPLEGFGRNTMCVLIGHFAAFKAVIALQTATKGLPFGTMLSHPCHDVGGCWWLLYFAAGAALPIIAVGLRRRLRQNCHKKYIA